MEPPLIKLFASDLDGTLLGASHLVSNPVRRAALAVREAGLHMAVSTGRTFRTSADFGFDGLGCDAVCANGSIVLTNENELIGFEAIDPASVEELLRAFPQAPFCCIGRERTYVTATKEQFDEGFRESGVTRRILMAVRMSGMRRSGQSFHSDQVYGQTLADVAGKDIAKINCRTNDTGLERAILDFLAERTGALVNAPFNPSMFELTKTGVSKATGVALLAAHYGIAEDEVVVYGDGGNDIAMLERYASFGHAYAPHGSCEDAKAAASEVLGSNVLYAVPRHIQATVRSQAEV